jgi:hypothetical protein
VYPFRPAPLISGEKAKDVNFQNPNELRSELNWSPPSLYIFHGGKEPWSPKELRDRKTVATNMTTEKVDAGFFGNIPGLTECLYLEFRQINFEEYSRSLFLVG